jgi:hypothetical protein
VTDPVVRDVWVLMDSLRFLGYSRLTARFDGESVAVVVRVSKKDHVLPCGVLGDGYSPARAERELRGIEKLSLEEHDALRASSLFTTTHARRLLELLGVRCEKT